MNRPARALLAFVVGFAGATAAVQALDRSQGEIYDYAGTPNFFEYCRDAYGSTAAALRYETGAGGWRCAARIDGLFQLLRVDVDGMCVRQFGDDAFAHSTNFDDAEAWECLR